jgi:hypothetical protein
MTLGRYLLIVVLAFAILVAMPVACYGQAEPVAGSRNKVSVEYLAGLYGVTFCRDAGSVSFVRAGLPALEAVGTAAHETKHIEQHQRFPNCLAFFKHYATPKGKMEIEAEAFHADWCATLAVGADTVSRRALYLETIQKHYVPGTLLSEIAQAFDRFGACKNG